MTPEEFRRAGHQLIDWIADYRGSIETRAVRAQVEPGDIRRSFAAEVPHAPVGPAALLRDLEEKIVPGITHKTTTVEEHQTVQDNNGLDPPRRTQNGRQETDYTRSDDLLQHAVE